ncbi:MAG: hypothetical protein ACTSYE_03835 [Alphaproteobacteria bacterium]
MNLLDIAPLLPLPWLAALAAIALMATVPGLLRRARAAWWRLLAVFAVLVALANPVAVSEDREPLSTIVALVLDRSASQTLGDRADMTTAARDALVERFDAFTDIELRIIEAGQSEPAGAADGTHLFTALATSLGDVPPERVGAVIMVTDGQVHDVPDDIGALPAGAPLHVLVTGHPSERDRRIEIESAPRFGIVNERQNIKFRIVDEGGEPSSKVVDLIVSRDGEPLAIAGVNTGELITLEVDIPHGGSNIFELHVTPLDDELTELNNIAVVPIEGIRENLRVLLVSGEPHAGERTWRNLLKSDAAVDLVHFTILRPPSKQDGTPINQLSLIAFPTRELFSEKIDEFDLIIFDRYHHRGVLPLLYFDNIAQYVRGGGALLVAAGPEFAGFTSLYRTPLSPILPVVPTGKVLEQPHYPRVTQLGNRHPVTRALEGADTEPPSWGRFFRLIEVSRAEGNVLMNGVDENPLLVLNRVGDGRIAVLLSDHTWLWARGFEGGGPHVDLLRRLAHWLMKEPDLEEEALRARTIGTDLVVERQTMGTASESMIVQTPSGGIVTLTPSDAGAGMWRATTPAEEIGLYRVQQGERRAFAHNGPANPLEFVRAYSTAALLKPLVDQSGGRIARLAAGGTTLDTPRIVPVRGATAGAGRDWIGVRLTDANVLKGISRTPLMMEFGGVAGIVGLVGLLLLLGLPLATWLREGR